MKHATSLVLSFLLVSSLFLLRFSFPHPQHHDAQSLQQSTHPFSAIDILQTHNRIICRIYHACRSPNGHLRLPRWMKSHKTLLHTRCGLTNFDFSWLPSLNNASSITQYDLITPDIPAQRVSTFVKSYLPSFFLSNTTFINSSKSNLTDSIKRTCLSPTLNLHRSRSNICHTNAEQRITYPAIILPDHLTIHSAEHSQRFTAFINHTFYTTFASAVKFLSDTQPHSATTHICFRSFITSPMFTPVPTFPQHKSTHESARESSVRHTKSILQPVFVTISNALKPNETNAMFQNNHPANPVSSEHIKNRLAQPMVSNPMHQLSSANTFALSVDIPSSRKLLSQRTASTNFSSIADSGLAVDSQPLPDSRNTSSIQADQRENLTQGTTTSVATEALANQVTMALEKMNASAEITANSVMHENPGIETNHVMKSSLLNNETTRYSIQGETTAHATLKRAAENADEDVDDVEGEGEGDLLPTFRYLIDSL